MSRTLQRRCFLEMNPYYLIVEDSPGFFKGLPKSWKDKEYLSFRDVEKYKTNERLQIKFISCVNLKNKVNTLNYRNKKIYLDYNLYL